jgi:hypothetical protein
MPGTASATGGVWTPALASIPLPGDDAATGVYLRAVQNVLSRQSPIMLARLVREAEQIAREWARDAGVDCDDWTALGERTVESLLATRALVNPAGRPIPHSVGARAALVSAARI